MSYPYRENLEVIDDSGAQWIRCRKCAQKLCKSGEDWKEHCRRRTFAPTHAGPLMNELTNKYLLEKVYCPSCGTLLNSDFIEADSTG